MKPSFRSSSLDRVFECPGSVTLEAKVHAAGKAPKKEGHAVQWAGTWCHWKAATRLIEEFGAVGVVETPDLPADWKPSGYDEWVVEWYLHRVLEMTPRDYALFVEQEVAVEFGRWKSTGHIDVYALSPDRKIAVINDLKRGFAKVDDAVDNWQLANYGVQLKACIPLLETVILRIHQPAAPDRTTEATVTNLDALTAAIAAKGNETLDNPYSLSTGKQCNYCDAYEICPALRAEIKRMKMQLTKEAVEALNAFATDEELAEVVSHGRKVAYPIQKFTEALKERLATRLGQPVDFAGGGVTAVDAFGDRTITDNDYAYRVLSEKVGSVHAIKAFTPSLGKIEEVLHKEAKLQKTSKKPDVPTCQSWIKENLGGVITREKTIELQWR